MKKLSSRAITLLTLLLILFNVTACRTNSMNTDSGASSAGYFDVIIESSNSDVPSLDLGDIETIVDKDGEPYVTPQYDMRDQTVSFLSHWTPQVMTYVLSYMEKYKGPQVNCLTYPYGDCGMKLQAMVLAGNSPDVYKLRIGDLTTLLFNNVWSDVTNDFDWDNRNWRDLKPFMQYVTINDKILAAPEVNTNQMIWFNKSIFQEYGIEDPLQLYERGEWNLDNFDYICRRLTVREGGNTVIYGFAPSYQFFNDLIGMWDTNLALFENGRYISNTDDPKIADVVSYVNQMCAVEKTWCDIDKACAYFASGKVAMLYYGNWLGESEPFRSMNFGGKIDLVPLPDRPENGLGPRQDYYVEGHAIPVGAVNREGAKAFIEIFNYYKQSQEEDLETTKKDLEHGGLTVDQFFRYRSCRYYKNPFTALILSDWSFIFNRAMKGESWYEIKGDFDARQNLVIDSLPQMN